MDLYIFYFFKWHHAQIGIPLPWLSYHPLYAACATTIRVSRVAVREFIRLTHGREYRTAVSARWPVR